MLGQKVKLLREFRNLSQDDLAKATGIPQNSISRIENNQSKLKAEEAEKIAEVLQISISDLLSKDTPVISFSNNTIEKGYIHNHYEMQKDVVEKLSAARDYEIATLKEEINYLRKQNESLLHLIEKK